MEDCCGRICSPKSHPFLKQKTQLLQKRDEEVRNWSIRWEKSNKQLLQVLNESSDRQKEIETLKSKVGKVESKADLSMDESSLPVTTRTRTPG